MSHENVELFERLTAALDTREMSDELAEEILAPDLHVEHLLDRGEALRAAGPAE